MYFCSARCSGFHVGFAGSKCEEERLPKTNKSLVLGEGGDDFDDDVLSYDKDFYTKLLLHAHKYIHNLLTPRTLSLSLI